MLLRGKYNVLINVTLDCFDQSNFYISRINNIEWINRMYCSKGEEKQMVKAIHKQTIKI